MKKKNLEQALTMGLLLTSSMYNVGDAQEIIEEGIELNKSKQKYVRNLTQNDLIITGKGIFVDNQSADEYKIEIDDIGKLTLNKTDFSTDSVISLNGNIYTLMSAKSINIENPTNAPSLTAIKLNTLNQGEDGKSTVNVNLKSEDLLIKDYARAIHTNKGTKVEIEAQNNRLIAKEFAIDNNVSMVKLVAQNTNTLSAVDKGATTLNNHNGNIQIIGINNEISAADNVAKGIYYAGVAINNKATKDKNAQVEILAKNSNQIFGTIISEGSGANTILSGEKDNITNGARSNILRASNKYDDVLSTIIAKDNATIKIIAGSMENNRNYIESIATANDDKIKTVMANSANIMITGYDNAIYAGQKANGIAVENTGTNSNIKIYAKKDNVISGALVAKGQANNIELVASEGEVTNAIGYTSGEVNAEGTNNIISSAIISTDTKAIIAVDVNDKANISILSGNKSGQNYIKAEDKYNGGENTEIAVNADAGNIDISANSNIIVAGKTEKDGRGIAIKGENSRIEVSATASNILAGAVIAKQDSIINLGSKSITENRAERNKLNQIVAKYDFKINDEQDYIVGLVSHNNSKVNLWGKENLIAVNIDTQKAKRTLWAKDSNIDVDGKRNTVTSGYNGDGIALFAEESAKIKLHADISNIIEGSIIADKSSDIQLTGKLNSINSTNYVKATNTENIVSAVHVADKDSSIVLHGESNVITTDVKKSNDKEYAIWAEQGTINIDGKTTIVTANGSTQKQNNIAVAIVAGNNSATKDKILATINGKLHSQSYIYGDIIADKNGAINLTPVDNKTQNIYLEGNILAGNGGNLNIDLGDKATFIGRIDNYADVLNNQVHGKTVFASEFAQAITTPGKINLHLGENSHWNVTGQSWIDTLKADDKSIIDMTGAKTENNISGDALTINTFKGTTTVNMKIDTNNKKASDMLYIKKGDGEIDFRFDKVVDAKALKEKGIRFATIGHEANINIKSASTINAGTHDLKYLIVKEDYKTTDRENIDYNGATFDQQKPGHDTIDSFFDDTVLSTDSVDEPKATNLTISNTDKVNKLIPLSLNMTDEEQPIILANIESSNLNNIGKTIINLSQANYNNAVFMDSMNNKRGEARYLEGDEGFWVRMGHANIGKKAFEINNNVYQLGYDKLHKANNSQNRIGVVADYMTGKTNYKDISATGQVSRKGLWFYNTWTADDGRYSDIVAKWGHLENEFELSIPDNKIIGDYTNNVFSISGEVGYKKNLSQNWQIEPQIQMQYAYITGANYRTTQDTKVKADDMNSLIARAGIRLVKDVADNTAIYVKADAVHEFLGNLAINTTDDTGKIDDTFRNKGTWYNLGFGVTTTLKDNTYAYVNYEKSFGNDNANTYQVNGGVRWAF